MKKTYILLRNTDYTPTGPFRLGSLLSEPAVPESLIENSYPIPFPPGMPVQTSSLADFKTSSSLENSGKYGIFAKFLSTLGISADVNYEHQSKHSREINAERLETQFITPTREYLDMIMNDSAVQAFVQEQRFRANVYVVTGLRVALGVASGSESEEVSGAVQVSVSVDATTATGIPVQAGPNIGIERGMKREVGWGAGEDFVYAYRVKEVKYSVMRGRVVSKDVKGDLYSIGGKKVMKEDGNKDVEDGVTLEVQDVGPEWVTAKVMRVKPVEVMDEAGEACEIIMP
jgi:hypothetical protein